MDYLSPSFCGVCLIVEKIKKNFALFGSGVTAESALVGTLDAGGFIRQLFTEQLLGSKPSLLTHEAAQ